MSLTHSPWRVLVAGLGLALAGAVVVPGTAQADVARAGGLARDTCVPALPIPGVPPICVPIDIPGGPTDPLDPCVLLPTLPTCTPTDPTDPGTPGNPGLPSAINATTPTTINGDAKVGKILNATEPTWDQSDVITTYQWQRAGVNISGATAQTYPLVPDDLAKQITVVATGSLLPLPFPVPLLTGTSTSDSVTPVKGDAIKPITDPKATGSSAVGGQITADSGEWGMPTPTFDYQWYRTGARGKAAKIDGETTTSYSPVAGDAGRRVVLLVTAERPGYEKGLAITNILAVPKYASSIQLGLSKKKVAKKQTVVAGFLLRASDGAPAGRVLVYDGARKILTTTVSPSANGSGTVKLPRLKPGVHRIKAIYRGDTAHIKSRSSVVKLTVRRRGPEPESTLSGVRLRPADLT